MTQEDQGTGEATRAKLGTAAPGTDLVLRDTQNWSSRSHRELYEAVHNDNEPGRVGELAQDWSRMGTEIGDSSQRMAERLRGTEEGWQGEAAQSARGAIHELARWTSDAGDTAGDLGKRIGEQGQVMEAAKTSMPEPKDVEFKDEIVGVYGSLGRENGAGVLMGIVAAMKDMKQQQDKADSAHDQAVAVMERMESDSRVVDGSTPRFEPPPDPIRDGEKAGVKANSAFQPNGTPESTGSAGASGPGQAPGVQQPVTPGGEQPSAPGAAVPPTDPQQGGAEATKRMAALNTPASNTSASAPQLEHTSQVSGDKGGSNQGAGARVPSLDGFGGGNNQGRSPVDRKNGPESTTSQGSGPKGKTSPNSVDPPTIKHRPVPKLESPDTPGGGPVAPGGRRPGQGPGGGTGPGGTGQGRSGWSGAIPPIPSTGGSGSGGSLGAGGAGGSQGAGGSGGAGGSQGAGGSGGSNVGAGGRSSVGTGPTGGPAAGPAGGGSVGAGAGAGAGGMGAPGAAAGRGRGGEDEERRAKYVESTPIVEVPGADLPPPVIGGGKPKKKDG